MSGIDLIAKERQEQVQKHGFDGAHDEEWTNDELVMAAMYYALPKAITVHGEHVTALVEPEALFPYGTWDCYDWAHREYKERVEQLAIAGALIAAEIDRLQRKEDAPCREK